MNKMPRVILPFVALLLLTAGCTEAEQASVTGADAVRELNWDDLMPADYDPEELMPDIDVDSLSDDGAQAERYMRMLREMWDAAPVVSELDGSKVKIPGFVVPVEYDEKQVSSFLLVPYFGACIHVPPPPSNQVVHVTTGGFGPDPGQLWDPVWVSGVLRTEHVSSELAEAGYRLEAELIEPYVEPGASRQ